ncbi:hypothetical protein [Acetobacter sp.]|jgi:hypothetical protein|uniref:hypothetical protein n=1 Tax=Acetobacter sp. TaxID=440 RepID=UPI0025BD1641|nr:hypothetical protein [Acetobacter sp.]MCH4090748.1 hypothetical protein [Acetobacter sp.]MCI1300536.1 hypothetical protein [Acetobacter sp.]MCI1316262.1 hypothetical protein [Acetobacter sp.]
MKKTCSSVLCIWWLLSGYATASPSDVDQFLNAAKECQFISEEYDSSLPADTRKQMEKDSRTYCHYVKINSNKIKIKYKNNKKMIEKIKQYDDLYIDK